MHHLSITVLIFTDHPNVRIFCTKGATRRGRKVSMTDRAGNEAGWDYLYAIDSIVNNEKATFCDSHRTIVTVNSEDDWDTLLRPLLEFFARDLGVDALEKLSFMGYRRSTFKRLNGEYEHLVAAIPLVL